MNVLYLGHYRENTQLGNSSKRFIQGLIRKDINLSIRPLFYWQECNEKFSNFQHLEQNSSDKYDCVIQHTLPIMFSYNKDLGKNIGVVDLETQGISHSSVVDYLKLMDTIYVRSKYSYLSIKDLIPKIKVVHEPFDPIENYDTQKQETFKFFAEGNFENRYDLEKIILAFLSEFDNESTVQLILNVSTSNQDVSSTINKIYNKLRIIQKHNNNKIVVITNQLTGEQKDELLKTIDCAINIDKADSNGLFTIENLLYKNLVITQKQSASCDFINEDNGLLVDSFSSNVDMNKQYDNSIHSMYEYWYEADFTSLKQKMREACTLSTAALKLKKINIDDSNFSYTNFVESVLC